MKIEIGYQPNCSETVFRISKSELDNLPSDMKDEFWRAAANGYTVEDAKKNQWCILGLPNNISVGQDEYSTLAPEKEDQFCLYYYQTSNEKLIRFCVNFLKDWKAELPFNLIDGSGNLPKIPDENVWEGQDLNKGGGVKNSPPEEYSGIIELRRVAGEHAEEDKS